MTDPMPRAPDTQGLELRLLGGVELRGAVPGVTDQLLAQSKAVALLAFLALSPDARFQRRDRLVALLWPELDQAHARAALRKALFMVRGSLGPDVILSRGDDELAIAPDKLRCDVVEFESACDRGRLARALEIYRGDFMPGFFLPGCLEFERWVEDQRRSARERAAAASWALAVSLEAEHQLSNAGSWARRAVRHAWDDERVLRRAVTMLDRLGDRAGAVKLYEDFVARLRADLDVEPSAETVTLVNAIRAR
jgi:DNA-binding SARP family transcriptional activator